MQPGLSERAVIDVLRAGHPTRCTARGGSMWPAVREGATLLVTPTDARTVRVGEVIAFAQGGLLVVHRVVEVTAEGLRCQGDALLRDDGVIAWADVLGRAAVLRQRPLSLRWPRVRELRASLRSALGALRAGRA